MPTLPKNHAWSGTLADLTAEPRIVLLDRLIEFVHDATREQRRSWEEELDVLQREGAQVIALHPPASEDPTVLEYALPREAGRRPDVVVLQNGRVVVVEFKSTGQLRRVDVDQVAAYARDLRGYHSACEHQEVVAVLVLCGDGATTRTIDGVRVVAASKLGAALLELGRSSSGLRLDAPTFLGGEYAPLPSLVAAARLLFDNLPLPFIRRAQSAGVHTAAERVLALSGEARAGGQRKLVLVTGVPGAGKTLVGLQVVHSAALEVDYQFGPRRVRGAPATFLSGNGPLVQVLQNALKSTAFVQDMHRFIREYGLERPDRVPPEHLIVFDEAQRAWDAAWLEEKYTKKLPHLAGSLRRAEPEILISIADRIPNWSAVVALVGGGQEIFNGEEAGIGQWADALAGSNLPWQVHGPPALATAFGARGIDYTSDDALTLDTSLRAQAASDLHHWVEHVVDTGALDTASELAGRLRRDGFPIYVTRDLEAAKQYARDRFAGERERRFGLLTSSLAKNLEAHNLFPDFQARKTLKIGPWFNADPAAALSCCGLDIVVSEFECQGLELDLPIVCWGDDFWWGETQWVSRRGRPHRLVRDPHRLRTNAYRVLLTRGREGLVIFVPPSPSAQMDATFGALLRAGAVEARGVQMAMTG